MGTVRFLPAFLSVVILAVSGCTRDSTPPKADNPVAKNEVTKKGGSDFKVKTDLADNRTIDVRT